MAEGIIMFIFIFFVFLAILGFLIRYAPVEQYKQVVVVPVQRHRTRIRRVHPRVHPSVRHRVRYVYR